MKKGIDISNYQQNVNYNELKNQGIEFVVIRCGFGKNLFQEDKMFKKHYNELTKLGIQVGSYLYSYAQDVEGAKKEAKNCLDIIGNRTFELPIFYDLEDKTQEHLSRETITQMTLEFCKIIKNAGHKAGVYANKYWFENKINMDKLIEQDIKIWWAQYNENIKSPQTSKKVDMWQYKIGTVKGIQGNVDLDYCLCDCILKDDFLKHQEGDLVKLKVQKTGAVEGLFSQIQLGKNQFWKHTQNIFDYQNQSYIIGFVAYKDRNDYIISFSASNDSVSDEIEFQDRFDDSILLF